MSGTRQAVKTPLGEESRLLDGGDFSFPPHKNAKRNRYGSCATIIFPCVVIAVRLATPDLVILPEF